MIHCGVVGGGVYDQDVAGVTLYGIRNRSVACRTGAR
jgi:hypothetical protein